jgi:hypothetical protein
VYKSSPKFTLLQQLKKLSKVNSRPIGENSPDLVTLLKIKSNPPNNYLQAEEDIVEEA